MAFCYLQEREPCSTYILTIVAGSREPQPITAPHHRHTQTNTYIYMTASNGQHRFLSISPPAFHERTHELTSNLTERASASHLRTANGYLRSSK